MPDKKDINLLRDFLGISHWQSAVAIVILLLVVIAFAIFIKKTKKKIKFPIRIFIGMGIGLVFGLAIQGITGFNDHNISNPLSTDPTFPPGTANPYYIEWVGQTARWTELIKNIFITGITMLTVPIVFLAITRIVAKKSAQSGKIAKISILGILVLLFNVFVAFCIAFWLGYVFKIGNNFNLTNIGDYDKDAAKSLVDVITGYIPNSFIGILTQTLIVPVIILGALVGYAIKKLTKRYEAEMDKARSAFEIMWKIVVSILTVFIKIMPFAVLSMLASAIINQPIARLGDIGIIIGVAYLALLAAFLWHLFSLWFFGVKPWTWVQKLQRSIITGFASQSSNAALPVALTNLKEDFGVKEEAADTIMPLSTTIGLTGCAGVQAGIILSFLWFALINKGNFPEWSIVLLFINGLIVTLIASLGIAGVPGTAAVVTAGVLGGLGFGNYYLGVYSIIGALDGLFDMGRTALNISGGLQATAIVARNNEMMENEHYVLKRYPFAPIYKLSKKITFKHRIKKAQRAEKAKQNELKKAAKLQIKKAQRAEKAKQNKLKKAAKIDKQKTLKDKK